MHRLVVHDLADAPLSEEERVPIQVDHRQECRMDEEHAEAEGHDGASGRSDGNTACNGCMSQVSSTSLTIPLVPYPFLTN